MFAVSMMTTVKMPDSWRGLIGTLGSWSTKLCVSWMVEDDLEFGQGTGGLQGGSI